MKFKRLGLNIFTRTKALFNFNIISNIAKEKTTITLVWVSKLTGLKEFYVHLNKIGDQGTKLIADNLKELTLLYVSNNQIGEEGAKAISQLIKLEILIISSHKIGDEKKQYINKLRESNNNLHLECR